MLCDPRRTDSLPASPLAVRSSSVTYFDLEVTEMRRFFPLAVLGFVLWACIASAQGGKSATAADDWAMNATIIEACSCPMFCQCYFDTKPASHGGQAGHEGMAGMDMPEHFCKFNNAYQVNRGHYGATKLDGVHFWVSGDLGGDFSKGQMDWAVLTFDPKTSKEQRDGVSAIVGHVYPVKWNSFNVAADAPIEWKATKDLAEARLNGGKSAEVVLKRFPGMTDQPIVIKNLKYWGTPRNDGFLLMPNEVEAYREGDKAFEFKGTNGFMITFDIASKDMAPAK
jgi:hypothetical protein